MIQSFADKQTEQVWNQERTRLHPALQRTAHRKLQLLNGAGAVSDLRVPPGNRLEKLHGDRKGRYSIRINDQWRICFIWTDGGPEEVEIVDYH
ncbi:plasmid maintenance system killer protein [Saccharomonospora sp. CUA-673]|uniref:type II toxin-antitoxin system RelE/ParE family toxin n=1 Tax=Saccharomonospora sp. CUA-673 TaxID=1904969 RepID=UPI00095922B1|nr:type II toxin-antitoxin system RelE/ParE family toxin [Saccharomonospora sp. CUA-673]OLT48763.1 plasmid maintenance system killer protein [Saccharomonospora sp. CUA-673]